MTGIKYKIGSDFAFYKEKFIARKKLNEALKKGDIVRPLLCEVCDKEKRLEAHHVDYSRPLYVFWLCKKCHMSAHNKDSQLNPDNQERRPISTLSTEQCSATVAACVNFETFMILKKLAEENKTTVSALVRIAILKQYAGHSQNCFMDGTYEIRKKYRVEENAPEALPNLVVDEKCLLQSERSRLQKLRAEGCRNLPGMEEFFT